AIRSFAGRADVGLPYAERDVQVAAELGLDVLRSYALNRRAICRAAMGDRGALDDLREAITLGTETGDRALGHVNLASYLAYFDGPAAALAENRAGIAYAKPRGMATLVDWMIAGVL